MYPHCWLARPMQETSVGFYLVFRSRGNAVSHIIRGTSDVLHCLPQRAKCYSTGHMHTHAHAHAHTHTHTSIHTHMHTQNIYVCIRICLHIYMYVHMPNKIFLGKLTMPNQLPISLYMYKGISISLKSVYTVACVYIYKYLATVT